MAYHGGIYKFKPVFKPRLWGGERLRKLLGRAAPGDVPVGESWELFAFGGEASELLTPRPSLRTLEDLIRAGLVDPGVNGQPVPDFPLLFKWIDAAQDLSVQVHPPDGHPLLPPGARGKTECWVVLDADEGACVYIGLDRRVAREELVGLARSGEIARLLRTFPARPGDVFFVPAGTVHALGKGVTVAEIQQASDVTFRLYDWDRIDPSSGRPRELHVTEAAECVLETTAGPVEPEPILVTGAVRVERLVSGALCPAFNLARVQLRGPARVRLHGPWVVWMVLEGKLTVRDARQAYPLRKGETSLATGPAVYQVAPVNGPATFLETSLPQWAANAWGEVSYESAWSSVIR